MRINGVVGLSLAVLLFICFPATGWGEVYYLTDTTTAAGKGTYYQLETYQWGPANYYAILTADTRSNPGWYIDWFAIKFDGGQTGIITTSPLITSCASGPCTSNTGTWLVGDGSVDLVKFKDFPGNTWSGGYVDGVKADSSINVTEGAALDGSLYTWIFDFALTGDFNPTPSFQVGYYGPVAGSSSTIKTDLLSQYYQVPEPATLLLLGSGLLGLGIYQRKIRK